MRLLLDTHVLIWATAHSHLLSQRARALLDDPANELIASVVSAYEIEFKRDRDAVLQRVPRNLVESLPTNAIRWLSLTADHTSQAGKLPRHHGDPFDRFIIAQAMAENAIVMTTDRWFPAYGVPTIW